MPFNKNGKPSNCEPWNKGKKGAQVAWNKGLTKETNESLRKAGAAEKGHPNYNKEFKGCFKEGCIPWSKGRGKDRHYNKKAYIELRKKVYAKNNYTCLACGRSNAKGQSIANHCRLTLHHLLPVALFPEYVYEEDNVIVLCRKCHACTDTWGIRLVRKRDEFKERLSEMTLSQVREETLEKVQRLTAEAKVNDQASNCRHERPAGNRKDSLTLQATVRSAG